MLAAHSAPFTAKSLTDMKMLVLFQGDSITDAGRDRRNYYHLGGGYPKYAARYIKEAHPDADIEFINLGISGNRTGQLFDRLYPDAIALQPDIISVLIGINDVWHRHDHGRIATTEMVNDKVHDTINPELDEMIKRLHILKENVLCAMMTEDEVIE